MRILAVGLVLLFSGCSIARVTVRIQNGMPAVDFRFNQPRERVVDEYRIVYREPGNPHDNWNFDCHAESASHAVEQCLDFMPGAKIVSVNVFEIAE